MDKLKGIDILERMPGKKYIYKQVEHQILKYEFDGKLLLITTDKEILQLPSVDFSFHLKEFLPIEEQLLPVNFNAVPVLNVASKEVMIELKDVLLDNIKKVQENKDYIPQAQEINNQVKSMIDLAKTEIEFIKTVRKV